MTTDIRVEQWPHEIDTITKAGAIKFKPVIATIARVFDSDKGVGWRFEEDTTKSGERQGLIWNAQGPWNEDANKRDPYTGPVFAQGERVRATLGVRKGTKATYHDVIGIMAVEATADTPKPAAAQANGRTAHTPTDERGRSIERQVAAKGYVDLTIGLISASITVETFRPLAQDTYQQTLRVLSELWGGVEVEVPADTAENDNGWGGVPQDTREVEQ